MFLHVLNVPRIVYSKLTHKVDSSLLKSDFKMWYLGNEHDNPAELRSEGDSYRTTEFLKVTKLGLKIHLNLFSHTWGGRCSTFLANAPGGGFFPSRTLLCSFWIRALRAPSPAYHNWLNPIEVKPWDNRRRYDNKWTYFPRTGVS